MSERWTDAPALTGLPSNVLRVGLIQQRLTCLSLGILEWWAVAAAGRTAVDLGRAGWARIDSPRAGGVWSRSRPAAGCPSDAPAEPEAAEHAWNVEFWADPFSTEAPQLVLFQQQTFGRNSERLLRQNTDICHQNP